MDATFTPEMEEELKKLKEITKSKIAADESIRKNLDFKFEELSEYVDIAILKWQPVGGFNAACELAEKIKKFIPDLVIVENNFKQDFDQRNYMVSNAKLESKGWVPQFTLEDGIQELIQGYQLVTKFKNKDFTNL